MERFEVVSPVETIRQTPIAPRLHDLAGKTVGETWNGLFKGDFTFPLIRKLLHERFPGVKVIPYTEFPFHHGGDNPSHQAETGREKAQAQIFAGEFLGGPDDMVRVLSSPEIVHIIVCGDPNRNRVMSFEGGHTLPTTKRITLPADWDDLRKRTEE